MSVKANWLRKLSVHYKNVSVIYDLLKFNGIKVAQITSYLKKK